MRLRGSGVFDDGFGVQRFKFELVRFPVVTWALAHADRA